MLFAFWKFCKTALEAADAAAVAACIHSSISRKFVVDEITDAAADAAAAADASIAKAVQGNSSTEQAKATPAGRFFSFINLRVGTGEATGVFFDVFLVCAPDCSVRSVYLGPSEQR